MSKDSSSIPNNREKAEYGELNLKSQHPEDGNKQILGAQWPASLVSKYYIPVRGSVSKTRKVG